MRQGVESCKNLKGGVFQNKIGNRITQELVRYTTIIQHGELKY